jgi:hypothetical protein
MFSYLLNKCFRLWGRKKNKQKRIIYYSDQSAIKRWWWWYEQKLWLGMFLLCFWVLVGWLLELYINSSLNQPTVNLWRHQKIKIFVDWFETMNILYVRKRFFLYSKIKLKLAVTNLIVSVPWVLVFQSNFKNDYAQKYCILNFNWFFKLIAP